MCMWVPNSRMHCLKEREPEKMKHIKTSEQAESDLFTLIEMQIDKLEKQRVQALVVLMQALEIFLSVSYLISITQVELFP